VGQTAADQSLSFESLGNNWVHDAILFHQFRGDGRVRYFLLSGSFIRWLSGISGIILGSTVSCNFITRFAMAKVGIVADDSWPGWFICRHWRFSSCPQVMNVAQ
jgi:hypothetical protein